ncbi:MAG: tetratricopeptide repeat protein, partial [Myxococcota bacterium]
MKMWLCCAFVCSLVACQSSEEKWRSYHESAETYLSNGQHVEAILQYRNALKAKPKATESLRGLATAYRRTGEWIEALSVLDDLAVYAPEDRLLVERARYALAGEKAGLARRHIYDQRVTRSDDLEALVVAAWLARNEARRESAHQELFAGLKEGRTEALGVTGLPLALEARLALSTLDESLGRLDADPPADGELHPG